MGLNAIHLGDMARKAIHTNITVEKRGWAFDRVRAVDRRLAFARNADRIRFEVLWLEEATAFTLPGRYGYISRELLSRGYRTTGSLLSSPTRSAITISVTWNRRVSRLLVVVDNLLHMRQQREIQSLMSAFTEQRDYALQIDCHRRLYHLPHRHRLDCLLFHLRDPFFFLLDLLIDF